jgi:hypothetical protein
MTSANVTHYEIYGRDMCMIATGSQHAMCKDCITPILERWEKEFPDAVICLRWPDERSCDQYLTFDDEDGYTDDDFIDDVFMDTPRDTITLRAFMKRRLLKALAFEKRMVKHLREDLTKIKGNQSQAGFDYDKRKAWMKFKMESEELAADIGPRAKVWCWTEGSKFKRRFTVETRGETETRIANEAIKDYLATGLDKQ